MQAAQVKEYEFGTVLYMVMELSNSKWKLGFGNGAKLRRKSMAAREQRVSADSEAVRDGLELHTVERDGALGSPVRK